jgi:hypothetical protein
MYYLEAKTVALRRIVDFCGSFLEKPLRFFVENQNVERQNVVIWSVDITNYPTLT